MPETPHYQYLLVAAPVNVEVFAAACHGLSQRWPDAAVLLYDLESEEIPLEWRERIAQSPGNWMLMRVDMNAQVPTDVDDDDD